MTLDEKVENLKLGAYAGLKLAMFWENAIAQRGIGAAEAFYIHLGLNHLETKGTTEWEGLTLSREPKEHEKLCIKGIANAQETAKGQIGKILLSVREELIAQGLEDIEKLPPKVYHMLVLAVSKGKKGELRAQLDSVYTHGRALVAQELTGMPKGKHIPGEGELRFRELGVFIKQDDDFDSEEELDELEEVTEARVVNDVQSRITAAAARFVLLGLAGAALLSAIQKEIEAGSVSYIDRASTGLANRVINIGRGDEARDRDSQWERVEYSALLDQNVCGPCAAEDGKEAENEDDLTPAPNPECEGGDWCRCFHIYVAEGNM